jgi:hypothetical protein
MDVEAFEIRIDEHALYRYCERVDPITRSDLEQSIRDHLRRGYRFQKGYLQTGDIWWRASRKDNVIILHSCYGRTHIDIPEAVRWAKRNGDRVFLGNTREPMESSLTGLD